MAVVNVGVLMALAGHRVLLVDWDLEAPASRCTSATTQHSRRRQTRRRIVDLLERRAKNEDMSWTECVNHVAFQGATLDLISAGRRSEDYRSRVQKLDWSTLYREHKKSATM